MIISNFSPVRDYQHNRMYYVKMFIVLLLIEVFLEVFGYQEMGRWIYGNYWSLDVSDERWVHFVWMLTITTPAVYAWVIYYSRREHRLLFQIQETDRELQSLFFNNSVGVMSFTADGQLLSMNSACEQKLGFSVEDLKEMESFRRDQVLGSVNAKPFVQMALLGHTSDYENTVCHRDGRVLIVEEKMIPIFRGDGVSGYYKMIQDVTEQRQAQQRILYLAHYDSLTNLPNRAYLSEQLTLSLEEAKKRDETLGVLFIDLDRFKHINDALGHNIGDKVLCIIAQRLTACTPEGDLVARFGGDEFVMIIRGIQQVEFITNVAEQILDSVHQLVAVDGYEFEISASIGISIYPVAGDSCTLLLRAADEAMYEAKRAGKNHYRIHMNSMQKHVYERFRLENDFRKALRKQDELFLEYQPQVDVDTGKTLSAEALIRWNHPMIGVIPPNEFIPLAEETGLIVPLGRYVLRKVCLHLQNWYRLGKKILPVAINVSPIEIEQKDFIQNFMSTLQDTGILPQHIAIEITENALLKNERATIDTLTQLKSMGIKILLDDFGKEYSSLGSLLRFPVDIMKIDEMFIREIDHSKEDVSVVSTLITLAHLRHMDVIAEGVEKEQQLVVLRENDCDQYQGYLFCRPVAAEVFFDRFLIN